MDSPAEHSRAVRGDFPENPFHTYNKLAGLGFKKPKCAFHCEITLPAIAPYTPQLNVGMWEKTEKLYLLGVYFFKYGYTKNTFQKKEWDHETD